MNHPRRRTSAKSIFSCIAICSLAVAIGHAQTPVAVQTVEIPTLVTDHEHRPVGEFHADAFTVKVDSEAPFSPLSIRKEGTDPLSLVILLDASRDSFHDLKEIGADLAALVGGALDPHDRISLYAFDCKMARSLYNAPPNAELLRKAVTDSLDFPSLHAGKKPPACGKTVHLWDNVAVAVSALSHLPGRRAIILVSAGSDGGSKYDWQTVQQYAVDQGVAIFGLRDQRLADADDFSRNALSTQVSSGAIVSAVSHVTPTARDANSLELLCANAGGLTLTATNFFRKDALADILFLLRSRIILTVPASDFPTSTHAFKVSLPALTPYFVTATGWNPVPPSP